MEDVGSVGVWWELSAGLGVDLGCGRVVGGRECTLACRG